MRRHPLKPAVPLVGIVGLVLAAACVVAPAWGQPPSTSSPEPVTVEVATGTGEDRRFLPAVIAVAAGAELRLRLDNRSSEIHNLSFTGSLDQIRTRTMVEPGQEDVLTFVAPDPGVYPFVCTVHEGMNGELQVTAVALPY